MAVVVDTGVLVSAADLDEPRHKSCAELLRSLAGDLFVPAPVVPEAAWLIDARLGPAAEIAFLGLITSGELEVVDLGQAEYQRCVELIGTYADLGLGLVDASVVIVAENLRAVTLATLNHRDFNVVRPAHTEVFELVP